MAWTKHPPMSPGLWFYSEPVFGFVAVAYLDFIRVGPDDERVLVWASACEAETENDLNDGRERLWWDVPIDPPADPYPHPHGP